MCKLVSMYYIRDVMKSLSAGELSACAQEVIAHPEGIMNSKGALLALATRLENEDNIDRSSFFAMAADCVVREATLRFVSLQTGLRVDQ